MISWPPFYSLEYRNLVQNYFNLISISKEGSPGEKAVTQTSRYSTGQLRQLREAAGAIGQGTEGSQIDYYRRNLYNYRDEPLPGGRNGAHPNDSERHRNPGADCGLHPLPECLPGLRFDRGTEFFRIADLSRVWILADIFETEASYFKPGMRVKMELPYQKRTLYAEVSPVLPQFDPATRTLKVRLEADNPGYRHASRYVRERGTPRERSAGDHRSGGCGPRFGAEKDGLCRSGATVISNRGRWKRDATLGERVEIARGLMPGEKIVVSGNFLIDSEARMQQAASGIIGKIGRDPVCGMNIDEDRAKAEGNLREYKGKTYFFCSPECRDDFGKDPERYLKSAPAQGAMPMAGSQDAARSIHARSGPKPRGAKALCARRMTCPRQDRDAGMPALKPTQPERQRSRCPSPETRADARTGRG